MSQDLNKVLFHEDISYSVNDSNKEREKETGVITEREKEEERVR